MVGPIMGGAIGGAGIQIVITAIDKYSREFNKLENGIKKQQTGFQKLTGFLRSTGIGYAALAGAAVGFAVKSIQAFLDVERAAQAFNIVVGETADILLTDLRDAARGMVSDFELMQAANNALLLGIEANKLPQLMEIAAARGKIMGRTVTEAFNDITIGIGRQSRMILDNLGIIVDAEEAYRRYALSIGKTADELTEMEKKQAFVNEVISQSEGLTLAMAAAEETHGEKLQRGIAIWKNFLAVSGEAIINLVDLTANIGKVAVAYDLWQKDVMSKEAVNALQEINSESIKIGDNIKEWNTQIDAFEKTLKGLTNKVIPEQIKLENEIIDLKKIALNLDPEGAEAGRIEELIKVKQRRIDLFELEKDKIDNISALEIAMRTGQITTIEEMKSGQTDILAGWDEATAAKEKDIEALAKLNEAGKQWADSTIGFVDRVKNAFESWRSLLFGMVGGIFVDFEGWIREMLDFFGRGGITGFGTVTAADEGGMPQGDSTGDLIDAINKVMESVNAANASIVAEVNIRGSIIEGRLVMNHDLLLQHITLENTRQIFNNEMNRQMTIDSIVSSGIELAETLVRAMNDNTEDVIRWLRRIEDELKDIERAIRNIEGRQSGGPIHKTGLYNLHAGEFVIPPGGATVRGGAGIIVNINHLNGFNARDIAEHLQEELSAKISI